MSDAMFYLLCILWIISGVVAYAGTFAYFQKEYPFGDRRDYRNDMAFSVWTGLFGIIGLAVSFFGSDFYRHGFKFR